MFLTGDKFFVERNGFKGEVLATTETEYKVKWEHFTGEHNYLHSAVDRYWKRDANACNHETKTYEGFREAYIYCVKCNKRA